MSCTYLFYDIETTGLNKCFDQILQFAAIRTDLEFNELERYNILIKLNPDIIPSPQAFITHNIPFSKINNGLCEYEAILKIHQLLNQPGTISVGYNTLSFDDEFLRFSFFRNLLPPYTHQYANNCSRMDIYPIVAMYFLYKNEALEWPTINGKPSLKLEQLNLSNKLLDGEAHDALFDVQVTIELAKKLIKHKEMWNYVCEYFIKKIDEERAQKLTKAIMVNGKFGADNYYQFVVLYLGAHNHYKNQTLWLRLDSPELVTTTFDSIPATNYVVRKKAGELGLLLPTTKRFTRYLTKERLGLVAESEKWLAQNPKLLQAIADYYKEYKYPLVPNADIETTLYVDGFWSKYDMRLCAKFHNASNTDKLKIIEQFNNDKIKKIAIRLLGRNYPDILPAKYQEQFADYLQLINTSDENNAIIDFQGCKKLTPKFVLSEIGQLEISDLDEKKLSILQELKQYVEKNA